MDEILIIEDEKRIVRLVKDYMKKNGFSVISASNGQEGLDLFDSEEPDAVILDLMLPKIDGMEVARKIRQNSDTPIIMLTARTEEADRVAGLEIGADDYITKPFSLRELSARVKAVLRRVRGDMTSPKKIKQNGLIIDVESHQVKVSGKEINLTPNEFDILTALARSPGQVFSRSQLLKSIGHYPAESMKRTIDTHIKNLRKKIEPDPEDPKFIETVHGIGYRFKKQ